jgi:hypothetical protein
VEIGKFTAIFALLVEEIVGCRPRELEGEYIVIYGACGTCTNLDHPVRHSARLRSVVFAVSAFPPSPPFYDDSARATARM